MGTSHHLTAVVSYWECNKKTLKNLFHLMVNNHDVRQT